MNMKLNKEHSCRCKRGCKKHGCGLCLNEERKWCNDEYITDCDDYECYEFGYPFH